MESGRLTGTGSRHVGGERPRDILPTGLSSTRPRWLHGHLFGRSMVCENFSVNLPDGPPVSPDGVVSLTFLQSESDFRAAVDVQSARWPARILYGVFAVCATYAAVVFVWYFVFGPIQSLVPVVVISVVLCVVSYFGIKRYNKWVVMRRLLKSKQGDIMGSTCTITIKDGMLALSAEPVSTSMTMPVSRLERVDETKTHVLLWTTPLNVIPIPRQSVPETDLDAFLLALSTP